MNKPYLFLLMNLFMKFSLLSLTVLLFTNCSPKSGETEGATTSIENGATVVSNPKYGGWQSLESPVTFELIEEFNFEHTEEVIVGQIWNFVTDEEGRIYIYDFGQSKIYAFDPEGNFVWETGQEGSGPGDLSQVRGMILHDNLIYVSNVGGSRLDVFSLEGEYISSASYSKEIDSATLFGFTEEGNLVLSRNVFGTVGTRIHIVEFDGASFNELNSFIIDQSGGKEIPSNVGMTMPIKFNKNYLISAENSTKYLVNFYDLDGEIYKIVKRDFSQLVGIGSANERTMSFGGVQIPIVLEDGSFFALASWPIGVTDAESEIRKQNSEGYAYPDYQHSLDYFSPDGELLYSLEGDGRSSDLGYPVHVDQNDHIYFRSRENGLLISKYKVLRHE